MEGSIGTHENLKSSHLPAAFDQNRLPLQQLVDRDGKKKQRFSFGGVFVAGIQEVCVIISPGDERAFMATTINRMDSGFCQHKNNHWATHALLLAKRLSMVPIFALLT